MIYDEARKFMGKRFKRDKNYNVIMASIIDFAHEILKNDNYEKRTR